jgi:hypothetical protein
MCYKSPGPRCYGHANEDAEKLKEKRDASYETHKKALADAYAFQADYERLSRRPDAVQSTVKFYKKSAEQEFRKAEKEKEKHAALAKKYDEAKKDAYATAGGIEKLQEEIAILEDKGYGAEFVKDDLREARQTYNNRMEKYDERHQTVFGRKPSPHGDDEGIDKLRAKLRKNEARLAALHKDELVNDTNNRAKIDRAKETSRRLRGQLKHAYATDKRRRDGIIHDPKEVAAKIAQANAAAKRGQDSWDRSDTDGFMSQWASGVVAEKHRMEAELIKKGGKAEFSALFDKDGNMVPAKRVNMPDRFNPGSTKTAWGVLSDPNDPSSPVKEWINESSSSNMKTQEAYLAKKGYTMGTVRVPAYVTERGNNVNVRSVYERKDKGFTPDAEVVTKNRYPALIKHYAKVDAENQRLSGERARAEQARRKDAERLKKEKEANQ